MKADFELARTGEQDPAELRDAVDNGAEEVDRMSAIVADLLMLSRIDAREEHLEPTHTDLDALLRDTVGKLSGLAGLHEVGITYQGDAGTLVLPADGPRLQRAVLNLCRNAIEHSPGSSEVTLSLQRERDQARVDVTDRGDGMTRDQLTHAFDRFYRADHSRQSTTGNSGLGLPIARWIVEAHRGTLTLASRPGDGTVATIRLPL